MPDIDASRATTTITPGTAATPTAEEKLAVVKAKLAELEALAAPVVAADILDVLAEIQEAI